MKRKKKTSRQKELPAFSFRRAGRLPGGCGAGEVRRFAGEMREKNGKIMWHAFLPHWEEAPFSEWNGILEDFLARALSSCRRALPPEAARFFSLRVEPQPLPNGLLLSFYTYFAPYGERVPKKVLCLILDQNGRAISLKKEQNDKGKD